MGYFLKFIYPFIAVVLIVFIYFIFKSNRWAGEIMFWGCPSVCACTHTYTFVRAVSFSYRRQSTSNLVTMTLRQFVMKNF